MFYLLILFINKIIYIEFSDIKGRFLGFNLCSLIVILILMELVYTNKNKIKKTYKRYLNKVKKIIN